MQTIMTPDSGTITPTRTLVGFDLEVKNAKGETIATVIMPEREAWALFQALGEDLIP
ncbi:hypothetical protein [Kitasatospora sp. NPDC001132]